MHSLASTKLLDALRREIGVDIALSEFNRVTTKNCI